MKVFMLIIGLLTVNLSALGAEDFDCYSFVVNSQGYSKICILLQVPNNLDSNGKAYIYMNEEVILQLEVVRKYFPRRTICPGKEHDCRQVGSSVEILLKESIPNENGIHVNMRMWQSQIDKCYSGIVAIINRPSFVHELKLKCPSLSW